MPKSYSHRQSLPGSWHDLYQRLTHATTTRGFQRQYRAIRRRNDRLAGFAEPGALIGWLNAQTGDPDLKNRVLHGLMRAGQRDPEALEVAQTLIILALWPGLDAVRGRLRRSFKGEPGAVEGEVLARLSLAITTGNTTTINRVAKTLLMNVERDVKRCLMREQRQRQTDAQAACEAALLAADNGSDGMTQDDLLAGLRKAFGADAALVELVAFADCSLREAGERLGLSHAAARKRHARVMQKLRARLSQVTPEIGF